MNRSALFGWSLAGMALAAGAALHGWRGVLLALSGIVFWLLLQFARALHALRHASGAPVGHVDSAVMLQSRLAVGQRLPDVVRLTRSLGDHVAGPGAQAPGDPMHAHDAATPGAPEGPPQGPPPGPLRNPPPNDPHPHGTETWRWRDPEGHAVLVRLVAGRVSGWDLVRAEADASAPLPPPPADGPRPG
jgi:hypothetical protein